MRRLLSLVLAMVLLCGMLPTTVFATEESETTAPNEVTETVEPIHAHAYAIAVTDPTCAEQGYTTYTCECGDSYVDDYVETTGDHTYENGSCIVCGATLPLDRIARSNAITTTDDLVLAIRQVMINRQKNIQLRLDGMTLTASDVSALFQQARAHTGVPYEGDYIRANMVGYSTSVTTGSDADGIYSLVTIVCNFISDAAMEAEVDAAVADLLNDLNLWDASNYEKVKGVYDWITENVQYDYEWDDLEDDTGYYEHTTHAALIAKNAVCQGFASLYYRLMLELGVDCRYISGISTDITGSENHAWNIVYLDGKYYNCDPTWDRSLMGHYRYFLCTQANFTEHTRDSEFDTAQFHSQYPMAVTPYVQNITASGQVNGNISWVLDGDTGTLTVAGTGAIPSYRFSYAPWYDYRESVQKIVVSEGITEVGERAFYWCTNCTAVQLPDSLIAVREYGFNNLRSLQQITLPPNLKIIEFCGFSECVALTSITLPDSVTTVESNAFSNCYKLTSAVLSSGMKTIPSSMFGGDSALRSVVLPEGITYIDNTAFINCGFTSFTLPASVTGLGTAVFSGCTSLAKFIVEEGNPTYKAVDGVLFSADGTHLICYPSAKTGNYTVPEGTRYIDYGAFRSQKYMNRVYFPSTLEKIDGYAFSYCKYLSSVTFNSNITTVGSDAFRSCTNLQQVVFENPNVNLVGYTFVECTALRSITLPANLREIPNGLLDGCTSLQSITIPSTVTKIGSSAFLDCDGLTSITIPGTVKSIGQQAFDFCNKLETIIFEEGVQTLGWISIRNAPKLKKVVIPNSVTKIEQPYNTDSYMFDACPNVVLHVNCGSYGYNYAVNRGLSYQASHVVNATTVQPTCTQQGYTRFKCACGISDYNSNYVPALGHDYTWVTVEHTCTEDGYTRYTCLVCGDTYDDDYVPAAHDYEAWYLVSEATCTADGQKQRDCLICGYSETAVIPASGHDYTSEVTAPTCTEQGYTTYTCTVCGDSYADDYVVAVGHIWDAGIVTKEPTEEETGNRTYTCVTCGATRDEIIPVLDHVHSYTDIVTAPSCTEQGYTTHTCRCGDSYEDDYVDALGHIGGAATCKDRAICTRCETAYGELNAANHTGETEIRDAADAACTEAGYTGNTHCKACGVKLSSGQTIPAKGHSFGQWTEVTAPTCTENGSERRDCANCDYYETREVDTLDHKYEAFVTEPTCTERGYTTYTCHCGDSYEDDYVDALGHIGGAATCKDLAICTRCETVYGELNLTNHTGETEIRDAADATCTEAGYTGNTHCKDCGAKLSSGQIIPAKGHSFGQWTEVTAPTCTEKGAERRDCENCDYYETRETDAKGHKHEAVVTDPTCTEQGFTTHTCADCGDSYKDTYVDALGHDFVAGKCNTCGESDPDYVPERLLGDVTGDGKVTATDYSRLLAHVKKVSLLTDADALWAADVTGDGKITATDYSRLLAHVKKVAPLW